MEIEVSVKWLELCGIAPFEGFLDLGADKRSLVDK
jgi:hypothetical protein